MGGGLYERVCGRLVPLLIAAAAAVGPAPAQLVESLPDPLQSVALEEKPDSPLPPDLTFVDESGRAVRLGDYFDGRRPVLLSLVYYRCPMLCTLVLDGMVDALREVDWLPGREFELLTVTIDPRETPALARAKKQVYVASYGNPEAAAGWHFLTGEAAAIDAVTDAVGFRYRYLEEQDEFAHPAALFVLTPDGRVSRYLYGVQHDPRTVRLSLVEAAQGKIGTAVDKFLLYCYRYDAQEGRYAPVARRIMRLGGALMVLVLGAFLLAFWVKESREKRLA